LSGPADDGQGVADSDGDPNIVPADENGMALQTANNLGDRSAAARAAGR
jgi:hypothetical protein